MDEVRVAAVLRRLAGASLLASTATSACGSVAEAEKRGDSGGSEGGVPAISVETNGARSADGASQTRESGTTPRAPSEAGSAPASSPDARLDLVDAAAPLRDASSQDGSVPTDAPRDGPPSGDAADVYASTGTEGGSDAAGSVWSDSCEGGTWRAVHGLNPVESREYIALREIPYVGPFEPYPVTIDSVGVPCEAASDPVACQASIELLWPGLVSTQGDRVDFRYTAPDVVTFLGPIDTPAEALLVAYFNGYEVECSGLAASAVRSVSGGYEVVMSRSSDCPISTTKYVLRVDTDGTVTVLSSELVYTSSWCVGRRPAGLRSRRLVRSGNVLGDHFAHAATLEAASVHAFRTLARELRRHGAPARLVGRALRAAREEMRHARLTARLARRFGARAAAPVMNEVVDRPLEAIAIENAVEGCVRETYGALVGAHQARAASDSAVRRIMKELSRDEIGHACLAWGVAEWAGTRLTPAERARVREARAEAVDQLRMEVDVEAEPDLVHLAGVPDATAARGLYSGLAREVWV